MNKKKCVTLQAMKRRIFYLIIIISFTVLSSCNSFEKLLKSTDYEAKYQAAMNYYNKKEYRQARELFENLALNYRGREHAEEVSWYYGKSLLESGYYYTAAFQFKSFSKRFPYSANAEEAAFLTAYCQYMESPDYYLDQTITKDAIAEFEQFAARYPQSVHIPEVNSYLDEMREKLIRKDYEIAYGYYKTESYRAAVVALGNFLNNYPESVYREDAMYYIIKAGYEYAINSREDKMKERLQQVVNDFDKFAVTFNNSKYMTDCQNIYTRCKAEIHRIEEAQ